MTKVYKKLDDDVRSFEEVCTAETTRHTNHNIDDLVARKASLESELAKVEVLLGEVTKLGLSLVAEVEEVEK